MIEAIHIYLLIYLSLIIFAILFQIGLVIGLPWGEYTMGGYSIGVLPRNKRIAAGFSIIVLLLISYIVIDYSAIFGEQKLHSGFVWLVTGFFILSFTMNTITRSKKERQLWQPITFALLILSLLIFYK